MTRRSSRRTRRSGCCRPLRATRVMRRGRMRRAPAGRWRTSGIMAIRLGRRWLVSRRRRRRRSCPGIRVRSRLWRGRFSSRVSPCLRTGRRCVGMVRRLVLRLRCRVRLARGRARRVVLLLVAHPLDTGVRPAACQSSPGRRFAPRRLSRLSGKPQRRVRVGTLPRLRVRGPGRICLPAGRGCSRRRSGRRAGSRRGILQGRRPLERVLARVPVARRGRRRQRCRGSRC